MHERLENGSIVREIIQEAEKTKLREKRKNKLGTWRRRRVLYMWMKEVNGVEC